MSSNGFGQHNHAACIENGMDAALAECERSGLQLTPVRQRVLEILLKEHRAIGAYDLLDQLRAEGLGSQPPVIYRALDFLVKHGFVHKIEKLNAFVACNHPGEDHTPMFLICADCSATLETFAELKSSLLSETALEVGFSIENTVMEAVGLCPTCKAEEN